MRVRQDKGVPRGSLRWIQQYVNDGPEQLDKAITSASLGRIATPIDWRSPLVADDQAEYRDGAFLDLLGLDLTERPLASFWPPRGPQWDALGIAADGTPILVEAKANLPEVVTQGTGAAGRSRAIIEGALKETAAFLGVDPGKDWTGTYYQYANRLAHLYLLHELNGIDAWLVNVYFIGDADVNGPETKAEWVEELGELEVALGLDAVKGHPLLARKVDVFVEVRG